MPWLLTCNHYPLQCKSFPPCANFSKNTQYLNKTFVFHLPTDMHVTSIYTLQSKNTYSDPLYGMWFKTLDKLKIKFIKHTSENNIEIIFLRLQKAI